MTAAALYSAHASAFSRHQAGQLSFQECWGEQARVLAQAEQLLRDQVAKLTLLQAAQPEPRDKKSEDKGTDQEQIKDEKNDDAVEAVTNTKKQTWGIGVLSNFIKQS